MKRREFITIATGAAMWPFSARAQRSTGSKVSKIGVLWHAANADQEKVYLDVLVKAFGDLGYVEGKNAQFLHKFPAEQPERFRTLARELVEDKVDVIVAVTEFGAKEVKQATSTIPVIVVLTSDPVKAGLVESLARPGGNITGLSLMMNDLSGKRLSLMKEMVPNLSRIALLTDIGTAPSVPAFKESAKGLDLNLRPISVTTPNSIDEAFSEIARDGFDGAIVFGSTMFNERVRVGRTALSNKVCCFHTGKIFPSFSAKPLLMRIAYSRAQNRRTYLSSNLRGSNWS